MFVVEDFLECFSCEIGSFESIPIPLHSLSYAHTTSWITINNTNVTWVKSATSQQQHHGCQPSNLVCIKITLPKNKSRIMRLQAIWNTVPHNL